MTEVSTADRVVVSVTATDSGDWQVVSVPTGFQGIVSTLFAENDYLHGFVRHEDGEQWEVYDFDGGDDTKLLQVTSISGTVTLARPATPYDSSKSDGSRMDAGSGTHTMTLSLGSGTLKRIFRELSPFWKTFTSADATPSVAGYRFFKTAGTTAITRFDDMTNGQRFLVKRGASDIVITHDGTNIDLFGAANVTLTAASPVVEFAVEAGVARQIAGFVLPLDEDDFASDSATRPPSQQSTKAYVASQILDEDDFASNSAIKAPSQQSVKAYVDALTDARPSKPSVLAATTTNITLSGTQTVDGSSSINGEDYLVKNQSAPADNGIYTAASGAWPRRSDMNTWAEVPGSSVWVRTGATNADTAWVCTADTGGTLGTTAINWIQYGGVNYISPATTSALALKVDTSLVGAASGLAQLGPNLKLKPSQASKAAPNGPARLLTLNSGWKASTPALNSWRDICWSPYLGLFAAVSDTGTGTRVMTSPDGVNWTTRTSAADISWFGICWSEEKKLFVAVGSSGTSNGIMTSPDGVTWTTVVPPSDNPWVSVCWAPEISLFCAIASSGTNRAMTSPDGVTWTARSLGLTGGASVAWSPELNLFVAVGTSGTNRSYSSPDGITWTARATADDAATWQSVCWANRLGLFVAVNNSSTGNRVMTSPDGITWTSRNSVADNTWLAVCWAEDQSLLVAVASSGTGNRVMTSPDGIVWTAGVSTADNGWNGVAYSPSLGIICAVSSSGTDRVMSTSGTTYLGSRSGAVRKVKALADMLALSDNLINDGDIVRIAYHSSRTDGGGGDFLVVLAANNPFPVDNLGCVYASAGTAYVFIRQEFIDTGMVNILWFGADRAGTDCTTAVQNMISTGEAVDTQSTAQQPAGFKPYYYFPGGYFNCATRVIWYPKHNGTRICGAGMDVTRIAGLTIAGCRADVGGSLYYLRVSDLCLDGKSSIDIGLSLGHPYRWASQLQTAASFTASVTTTAGSANATTASTASFKVGMPITSTNIPYGATIKSITNSTDFVIEALDNQAAGYGILAGTATATIGGNNVGGSQEARIERVKFMYFTLCGYLGSRDNQSRLINCYAMYNKYGFLNVSGVDTEFAGCHSRFNNYDGFHNQPWRGNDLCGKVSDLHGGFRFIDCTSRSNGRHNYLGTGGNTDTLINTSDTDEGTEILDWFTGHPAMAGASGMYVGNWWETYHTASSWANYTTDPARWIPRVLAVTAIANGITNPGSSIRVTCSNKHYFWKGMLLEQGMVQFSGTGVSAYDTASLSVGRTITDVIDEYTFEINIAYTSAFSGAASLNLPNFELKIVGQAKGWDAKSIKNLWFRGDNTNFSYFARCQDIQNKGCRYKNQLVLGPNVIGFDYDMFKGISPDVTDEVLYVPITGESALGGWARSGIIDANVTSGVAKTIDNVGYCIERPYSSGGKNADGSAAVMNTFQLRATFGFTGAWNRLADTFAGGIVTRGNGNAEYSVLGTAKMIWRASDGIVTIGNTTTNPGSSSAITSDGVALDGLLAPLNVGGYQKPAAILNRVNNTGTLIDLRYNGTSYGNITVGTDSVVFVGKNTTRAVCLCTYTSTTLDALDTTNSYGVTSIAQDGSTAGKVTITFPARPDNKYHVFLQQQSTGDPRAANLVITSKTTTTVVVEGRDASNVAARVPFAFRLEGV